MSSSAQKRARTSEELYEKHSGISLGRKKEEPVVHAVSNPRSFAQKTIATINEEVIGDLILENAPMEVVEGGIVDYCKYKSEKELDNILKQTRINSRPNIVSNVSIISLPINDQNELSIDVSKMNVNRLRHYSNEREEQIEHLHETKLAVLREIDNDIHRETVKLNYSKD